MRLKRSCRLDPMALAALSAASAAILLSAPAQYLGRQQDDLLYVIAAQALAKGGYRLFTSPGLPPLTMVSPGFPILLLPIALLTPDRFGLYQAYAALLLALCPWVLWLWLRKRLDRTKSLLICLLFALNPVVLSQAGVVMSEAPFFLATMGLLFVLDGEWNTQEAGSGTLIGGLLLILTQMRMAALAFFPAALIRPFREKRWKDLLWIMGVPAAGLAAFGFWSHAVGQPVQKVDELFFSYRGRGLLRLSSVFMSNARYYTSLWGSSYLPDRWQGLSLGLGILLGLLSLGGGLKLLRRKPDDAALWLLIGTLVLHGLWPWQYGRYLILPLPLLLWTLAAGTGAAAAPILGLLLIGQAAFRSPVWLERKAGWSAPELSQTYRWINSHTGDSTVLSSALYVRDGFYAGRLSLPLPDAQSAPALHDLFTANHVSCVVRENGVDLGLSLDASSNVRSELETLGKMLDDGRYFRRAYANPSEGTTVYEPR